MARRDLTFVKRCMCRWSSVTVDRPGGCYCQGRRDTVDLRRKRKGIWTRQDSEREETAVMETDA